MSTPTPPTAPAAPSPWMTRQEAADYLRVEPRTLDRIVREGKLTRFRMTHGDSPRFRRAEVMRLIEIDDKVGQRGGPNLVQATQRSLQSRGHETGPRSLTG